MYNCYSSYNREKEFNMPLIYNSKLTSQMVTMTNNLNTDIENNVLSKWKLYARFELLQSKSERGI